MRLHKYQIAVLIVVVLAGLVAAAYVGSRANSVVTNSPTNTSESVSLTYNPADGSLLRADQKGLSRWRADSGWQEVTTLQTSALSAVIVNPESPTTLYVSGRGLGIARSNDGGNTWQAVNTGLPSQDITALALHSVRRDTLFAWVSKGGIYRTEDGGDTWVQMPDRGPTDHDVRGLVFSTLPGSMNTGWLYASTPTGAFLSMDCFCGWRVAGTLPNNPMIQSIAVDPVTPKLVYSAGPAGLFRSEDGGLSWIATGKKIITGEPAAVTLDPQTPSSVFAVLVDGSVWHSSDNAMTWELQ